MWDATKAVLRGKFIALNDYTRKEKKPQINYLSFHLKKLENEEKIQPNTGENRHGPRWSETITLTGCYTDIN